MVSENPKRVPLLNRFVETIRTHFEVLKTFMDRKNPQVDALELKQFQMEFYSIEVIACGCGFSLLQQAALFGRFFSWEIATQKHSISKDLALRIEKVLTVLDKWLTSAWFNKSDDFSSSLYGILNELKKYYKKQFPQFGFPGENGRGTLAIPFSRFGGHFGVDLPSVLIPKGKGVVSSLVLIDFSLYSSAPKFFVEKLFDLEKKGILILHGQLNAKEHSLINRATLFPYYLLLQTPEDPVQLLKKLDLPSVLLKRFSFPPPQEVPSFLKTPKSLSQNFSLGVGSLPAEKLISKKELLSDIQEELSHFRESLQQQMVQTNPLLSSAPNTTEMTRLEFSVNRSVREALNEEFSRLLNQSNAQLHARIHSDFKTEIDLLAQQQQKKSRRERKLEQTGGEKIPISIVTKIISIISTILIFSILSVAFISSYRFGLSLKEATEATIRSNASEISSLLSQKMENTMLAIKGLQLDQIVSQSETVSDEGGSNAIDFFFDNNEDVLNFTFVGKSIHFSHFSKMAEFSITDAFFESIIEEHRERIFLTQLGVNKIETINVSSSFNVGKPILLLSYPYRMGVELVPLVLFLDISDTIMPLVESDLDVEKKSIFIVNRLGDLIAHSNLDLVLKESNFIDKEIVNRLLDTQLPGTRQFLDEEGEVWIGSFHPSSFADWGVVVQIREDEALKVIKQIIYLVGLITIIILSLSIFFIQLFSNSIVEPLRRLVGASKKVQQGDYSLQLRKRSNDEVGILTEAFNNMTLGLAERERLKDSFGKFVNKEVAEMAIKGEIKLGGEIKKATIFFSDIRSFTAISEKLAPDEVVEFLNDYMTRMVACVNKTGGTVDKYIGDAIMAIWGAPLSTGADAVNCVQSALFMREALLRFNMGRGGDKKPIIKIGCGINTGDVLAGQIGSSDKMEYTVIGDAVNLASRIEALNKPMGTDILVSSDTREEVKEMFDLVPMNKIMVKGKSQPQQIYAVLGRLDDPNRPKSLDELRLLLGIEGDFSNISAYNTDADEKKYEIIGKKSKMDRE